MDGGAYRVAAVRECFEECGILLAKSKKGTGRVSEGQMLDIGVEERERARKEIHGGRLGFREWVGDKGGVVDLGMCFSLLCFVIWSCLFG